VRKARDAAGRSETASLKKSDQALAFFLEHETPTLIVIKLEFLDGCRFRHSAVRRTDFPEIFDAPFEERRTPGTYRNSLGRRLHGYAHWKTLIALQNE
jgi:hypothetical protein